MYLKNIDVQFVAIEQWPGKQTQNRQRSPFRAKLSDTYALLERELRHLGCKRLIVQCDCQPHMIRRDGLPRADAKMRPGVILSFDSKYGPLSYPCDTFANWGCNIRAIALALQALRAVDRYGVTKRAEQYRGWQPLPPPTSHGFSSREAARGFLCQVLGWPLDSSIPSGDYLTAAIRKAQFATHPAQGGDPDRFKRVMEAERTLKQ